MDKCKNCGKELEIGVLCDCEKAKQERAMIKEVMLTLLKYVEELYSIPASDDEQAEILNEAFETVLTELAEKYGQEPAVFMEKVIDAIEEFVDEV